MLKLLLALNEALTEYRQRFPCCTKDCIGVNGHFGPCSDGQYLINTKRYPIDKNDPLRRKGKKT